jgi:GWxTD domain-containing protein
VKISVINRVAITLGALIPLILQGADHTRLADRYRDLLSGPPSLLLTKDERATFMHLNTDAERDEFLEKFWAVRNPTPGLQTNEFKEEFYRRVAYVNSYYGADSGTQGWRTDRGKTYILFGKPQTTMDYRGNQEIYPTELWFYPNPGLKELPPFFYVLFYEQNGAGGFHLYKPYIDGPDKLLREGGGSKSQAFRYLQRVSAELAHATLSWIPGEPVDTQDFNGSMASMQIVDAIEGFHEMPSYVSLIRNQTLHQERVTSKIEYKTEQAALTTFVVRESGKPWLHWEMQLLDPVHMHWTSGTAKLNVHSRLFFQGRLVFERTDTPSFPVPAASATQLSQRPFLFEDKIPVELGHYQMSVEVTNAENGFSYQTSKDIEVAKPGDRAEIGDVLVVDRHQPERRLRPFTFAGVSFVPAVDSYAMSSHGLSILYQIQLPANKPESLTVHYTVGSVSLNLKKSFEDKLDPSKADASGALLTAKTLPIEELGPGQYRLSIQVEDSGTKQISAKAVPFTVVAEVPKQQPVVIARGQNDSPQDQAIVHYERALCLLAQDRPSDAIQDLRASWQLNQNPMVKSLIDQLSANRVDRSAGVSGH